MQVELDPIEAKIIDTLLKDMACGLAAELIETNDIERRDQLASTLKVLIHIQEKIEPTKSKNN